MMAFTAVILAGMMQIGLGLLKLGKYFVLVPYPVISGFMTGIGVITHLAISVTFSTPKTANGKAFSERNW